MASLHLGPQLPVDIPALAIPRELQSGGSDEFSIVVTDSAARAEILRDAKHMADASETAFELWIDRVMHTR